MPSFIAARLHPGRRRGAILRRCLPSASFLAGRRRSSDRGPDGLGLIETPDWRTNVPLDVRLAPLDAATRPDGALPGTLLRTIRYARDLAENQPAFVGPGPVLVELLLEGTIFWKVSDVAKMIERTGDPKGDVWYHARSALIQAVSKVSLETFMASFNTIVAEAAATDPAFYEERGVVLHNLEVVSYVCKDAATASVLQDIIQETTNRINRMQKQRSENEVEMEKVSAQIEIEKQRAGLIKEQTANEKLQASVAGEAEGMRLAQSTMAFMKMLAPAVESADERVALLKFFIEQKTAVQQSQQRYANNPNLTTVIEGGAPVKPLPWMQVAE